MPKNNEIIQYGMTGSGSTFVWQILNHLFKPRVIKTHTYFTKGNSPVIVTYRDFRSFFTTMIRRDAWKPIIENIDIIYKRHFLPQYKEMTKYQNNKNLKILWLRYRDFIKDKDYLFNQFERFFDINIDEEQRKYLLKEYSMKSNEKRSDALGDKNCNKEYLIYKNHVGNGNIFSWKKLPIKIQRYLEQLLDNELLEWGFI